MFGTLAKLIVSILLLLVIGICLMFVWGIFSHPMVKDHAPALIMSLAVGASCIWGLIKIWKSAQRPSAEESPTNQKPFDNDAFEVWLKANGLASTDLPPERLFELRQAFLKQG